MSGFGFRRCPQHAAVHSDADESDSGIFSLIFSHYLNYYFVIISFNEPDDLEVL